MTTITDQWQAAPGRGSLNELMDRTAHALRDLQPAPMMVVAAPADKRLAVENEQLREQLEVLKAEQNERLRRRTLLNDRTIAAGRPEFCDGPPVPVLSLRGWFKNRAPQPVSWLRRWYLRRWVTGRWTAWL